MTFPKNWSSGLSEVDGEHSYSATSLIVIVMQYLKKNSGCDTLHLQFKGRGGGPEERGIERTKSRLGSPTHYFRLD